MRATVLRGGRLVVDEVPDPVPGPGEVLVETVANGICGSDLHMLRDTDGFLQATRDGGMDTVLGFDPTRDLVMGHEFSGRVIELGPEVTTLAPGDGVTTGFVLRGPTVSALGYSNEFPGGLGERMVLSEIGTLKVPAGVDLRYAALTEPLAVGLGSVRRSGITSGQATIVYGCGPVGLATIASLSAEGVSPIVAVDFSAMRRDIAVKLGASVAVDPREAAPFEVLADLGAGTTTVFNTVGAPGFLHELMVAVTPGTRIVQTGLHMGEEPIRPLLGVFKNLHLQFVLGYTPEELAESLQRIADGTIAVAEMVTGEVSLDRVEDAFAALEQPEQHAKILVEPSLMPSQERL